MIINYTLSVFTYALKFDISILDEKIIKKVIIGNIRLIEYCIENNLIEKRYDLLLLYYPMRNTFYWFLSKLYNVLI